jgi:LacI family transcriptional regulator
VNQTGSRRVTISEVAAHLGISKSTVSRAFNHPGRLLPETVSRVHEAAAALGYSPSKTAMALSTGLHSAIAVIAPDIANPFFPRLIRAAQTRANEMGMSIFLGDTDESATRERDLVSEFAPDVRGIVLMSSRLADETLEELAAATNLVLINRDTAGVRRVLLDTADGFTEALNHLYSLGHRRFVYIGGPELSWSHSQRLRTVQAFSARDGVSISISQALPATFEGGARAAASALADRPTAFLCFDDVVAQGAIGALSRLGLRVPDDVSVVGCDDTLATSIFPAMATVSLDYESAGRAAIDLLLSTTAGDSRVILPGKFVEGSTLGPVVTAVELSS